MNYPFIYPVIGFGRSPSWAANGMKGEWLQAFSDEVGISQCREDYIRTPDLHDMLLVDSSGRAWESTGVRFEGPLGSPWQRFLRAMFSYQRYRVHLDLVEAPAVSLDEVKARICRAIDADPDCYVDEELIAGEAGDPQELSDLIAALKTKVQAAGSNAELIEIVGICDELI